MIPTTTLDRIRAHSPCESGYKKLCKGLGGIREYGEDTPITVRQIVEIVGVDDALWCLRTMPEHNPRWRLLSLRYSRRAPHLMASERHDRGLATDAELEAARGAFDVARGAFDVARAAADAAADAGAWGAWDAAWDAERQWQADELIRISEEEL